MSNPAPKRRRLRWWIALSVGVATSLSVIYVVSGPRRAQRVTNAARSQGAYTESRFQGPEWLYLKLWNYPRIADLLSNEIDSVRYAESRTGEQKPIDLSYLVDAPQLTLIDASNAPEISDGDLFFVGQLGSLRHLDVVGPQITNEGAHHLSQLGKMEYLWLLETAIDDSGLQFLSGMPQLQLLSLGGSRRLTGEGLKHLPKQCRLEHLRVSATRFNHGLEYINVTALQTFFADSTLLTDEDLVHLRDAKALNQLMLRDTRITDEGLTHLAGLSELEIVLLSETAVTQAGAERLAARLPRVSIAYGPAHPDSRWAYGADADKPE